MKRGDIVTVAVSGDYGKPRPALIIQADVFNMHPSVTVLLITSEIYDAPFLRITVNPGTHNGLKTISQIMVDKAHTVPRTKVGQPIGHLDASTLRKVNRALASFLGLI